MHLPWTVTENFATCNCVGIWLPASAAWCGRIFARFWSWYMLSIKICPLSGASRAEECVFPPSDPFLKLFDCVLCTFLFSVLWGELWLLFDRLLSTTSLSSVLSAWFCAAWSWPEKGSETSPSSRSNSDSGGPASLLMALCRPSDWQAWPFLRGSGWLRVSELGVWCKFSDLAGSAKVI